MEKKLKLSWKNLRKELLKVWSSVKKEAKKRLPNEVSVNLKNKEVILKY